MMSLRPSIVFALECLEAGDQQAATRALLDLLEEGPRPIGVRCPYCRRGFDWPGVRDAHMTHCTAKADAA